MAGKSNADGPRGVIQSWHMGPRVSVADVPQAALVKAIALAMTAYDSDPFEMTVHSDAAARPVLGPLIET